MPFKMLVRYQNSKDVIDAALRGLIKGSSIFGTITDSSLREILEADMGEWSTFHQEVSRFYNSRKLQSAFKRCECVAVDVGPSIGDKWLDFATLEQNHVGSESNLSARFFNVVSRIHAVVGTLWDKDYGTPKELADMPQLPKEFGFGCAGTVPQSQRVLYIELDIVFKIPGTGKSQKVRVIGKMEDVNTYNVQSHWHSFSSIEHRVQNRKER